MSENESTTPVSAESRPALSLALPCYNEEDCVRNTAETLAKAFRAHGVDLELVLVDNGSTDRTSAIIDEMIAEGLPVVKQTVAQNRGYGLGVLTGLRASRGTYVGFLCADGQVEAEDVVKLYDVIASSVTPRVVKVRRRFRMDGFKRKVVSVVFNVVSNVLYGGLGCIDVNGNPKLLRREDLERMRLQSTDWFLDTEVLLKAKRMRLPVFEMNVFARMRHEGVSNVHTETIWEFIVNLLKYRIRGLSALGEVEQAGGAQQSAEAENR
jgi:glycosyltransferase involved in cell wall biosynthesis